MLVAKNQVVKIDYTLTDDQGTVIDTSVGNNPLEYIHGIGALIPGLEKEIEGKGAGAKLKVRIAPEDAYGLRDDSLIHTVPKSQFEGATDINVGMQFEVDDEHGQSVVTVLKVDNETVTVDANHPLAGQSLNFDVAVLNVRAATKEELEHGHVHGPHGHHHH